LNSTEFEKSSLGGGIKVSEQTTKNLIKKMFEKQDELNIYTNGSDWRNNKDLKWYRAIWTECAELIDYTNWKWWRKEEIKLKDIEMELIDIWHFLMSDLMVNNSIDLCTENIFYKFKNGFETFSEINMNRIQEYAEELARESLTSHECMVHKFMMLCGAIGPQMNISGIYKLYMGKNVLNKFRQDHGYKQQIYQKIWNEKEDNYYLLKFLDEIEKIEENFEKVIYDRLQEKYKKVRAT
jgi:hypothetical protein